MSDPTRGFTALFEAHHRDLLRYAIRRVADPADAADAVAETFTIAWRRLRSSTPQSGDSTTSAVVGQR